MYDIIVARPKSNYTKGKLSTRKRINMKKIISVVLVLVMLCATVLPLTFSVAAAPEYKTLPTGTDIAMTNAWTKIDDANTDMVKAYTSDSTPVDTAAIFAAKQNDALDASQQFKFFMKTATTDPVPHLYQSTSTVFNGAPNAYVTFTFTGTAVAYFSQFHDTKTNSANLDFYIDGTKVASLAANDYGVDTMPPADGSHTTPKVYFQATGLTAAQHVLKIVCATAGQATVDGFAYLPADPAVTTAPTTTAPTTTAPTTTAPTTEQHNVIKYSTKGGVKYFKLALSEYMPIGGHKDYTFCYDVYLTADVAGLGGLDIVGIGQTPLRDVAGGINDKKGIKAHPSSDISDHAYKTWYTREIPLTNYSNADCDLMFFAGEASGEGDAYFKNICVKDGSGKVVWSLDVTKTYNYEAWAGDANATVGAAKVTITQSGSQGGSQGGNTGTTTVKPLDSEGNIVEPWVLVDDSKTNIVRAYNSDKSKLNTEAIFAAKKNDYMDPGGQFKFFMGDGVGHLINGTSTVFNKVAGAYVEFEFNGTAVALLSQYHEVKANAADLDFYIDGTKVGSLGGNDYGVEKQENGAHTQRKVYFQKTGLSAGKHIFKVVCTSAGYATIDAFAYVPSVPGGSAQTSDSMIATVVIAAVACAGAVLVLGKKKA